MTKDKTKYRFNYSNLILKKKKVQLIKFKYNNVLFLSLKKNIIIYWWQLISDEYKSKTKESEFGNDEV